jgi:hypothetical protein
MGAGFAPAFVFLVPLAIWIYTLVFAFASLWFTHYCLGALQLLRSEVSAEADLEAARQAAQATPAGSDRAHEMTQSDTPLLSRRGES